MQRHSFPFTMASNFDLWCVIIGGLFISMALVTSVLKRLPLTTSILYMLAGMALGPLGFNLLNLNAVNQAHALERITEVAVLVSLFTSGLKLRLPLNDPLWKLPLRLAFGSMILTVGLIAAIGVYGLGLSLGASVLLGAILSPTDPVLASDVQVEDVSDRDRLRFSLTGEAGLNDGTAFPFVMLGLGLMGLHELGEGGWKWFVIDVLWSIAAGLGIGAVCGTLVGNIVLYLRREHQEAVGLDDFLTLGLIAFSYGAALLSHSYGFLAVFAAGVALRATERRQIGDKSIEEVEKAVGDAGEDAVTHPELAPAVMAKAILDFNEQLERIGEIAVVLLLGSMLSLKLVPSEAWWFVPLLFCVVRPIATSIGLIGARVSKSQRRLVGWFGIRGIGSVYYLMYAITHGVPRDLAWRLTSLTFTVVAMSVLLHGISVTPLMNFYGSRFKHRRNNAQAET